MRLALITVVSLNFAFAADSDQRAKIAESYGKTPLIFEANVGQAAPDVRYVSRGNSYSVALTAREAILRLQKTGQNTNQGSAESFAVRLQIEGGDPGSTAEGSQKAATNINYYLGNDPKNWHARVPAYERVLYKQVYPGIDLQFHGRQGRLEYDFLVGKGADPGRIQLSFQGASETRLTDAGTLVLSTPAGDIQWEQPVSYQETAGGRREVASRYVLQDGQVSFSLGEYDHSLPLVIDPILVYSTYITGTTTDGIRDLNVDATGNAYLVGFTASADYPSTLTPFQGANDIVVTKLNAAGTALVYSTFIGGTGASSDVGESITVDGLGNAYIAGETDAVNFPVTGGAFQTTYGGAQDAVVVKLDTTGAIAWSTYLGGGGLEDGRGIAVDSSFNVYVAGETNSPNYPVQAPLQGFRSGSSDVYVTKIAAAGNALVYSTYLGGTGFDRVLGPRAIAVDSSANAYVTGLSQSSDFPTVAGSYRQFNSGSDVFVSKVNAAGSALVYSTFIGGTGFDESRSIALDNSNNAYIAGTTGSFDFPVLNAVQSTFGGVNDAFLTKLNAAGSALVYSTFLGGRNQDDGISVSVDPATGVAAVTGDTFSADYPTASALQTAKGGASDLILSSTNGGSTWSPAAYGIPGTNSVRTFTFDAVSSSVYTSQNDTAILKSPNGANWFTLTQTGTTIASTINDLKLAPSSPSTMYVATASSGVYKSANANLSTITLTAVNNGIFDFSIRAIAVHPTITNIVFATTANGVFKTSDGAANWTRVLTNSTIPIAIDPGSPNVVYAGTSTGVFKSTDTGVTWFASNAGLTNATIQSLVIAPSNSQILYLEANGTVFRSANAGATWAFAGSGLANMAQNATNNLAVDPANPAIVYTGTFRAGVYKTTNSGATWTPVNTGMTDSGTFAVAFDTFGTLYAGTDLERDAFVTKFNASGGLIYSTFFGGPEYEFGYGVFTRGSQTWIAGEVSNSSGFPLTSAAFRRGALATRGNDGFVSKIDDSTPGCSYSVFSDTPFNYGGGGSGSVNVVAPSGCAWTAVSSDPSWLPVIAGASSTGTGVALFRTDTNPGISDRSGTITVQGNVIPVTQSGNLCTYNLSSATSPNFSAAGGPGNVFLANPLYNCSWVVDNIPTWVTVTSPAPFTPTTGPQNVTYTVAANPSAQARTDTIRIGNQTHTITQDGTCNYTLNPSGTVEFGPGGGNGIIIITTGAGCPWQVGTPPAFITVTSALSGTGNATLTYTVAANTTTTPRSSTLTISNRSLTINQQGTTCSFTATITQFSFTSAGGNFSLSFTANNSSCPWAVGVPLPSWVLVTSALNGTNSGTLTGVVLTNSTTATRTATITLANVSLTLTQTGTTPNTAPTATSVSPSSGSGSAQIFTFTFSDANGVSEITSGQVLFSSSLGNTNACNVHFDRYGGALWLLNDQATVWLGPMSIGVAGTLQNSQCSLDGATSAFNAPNSTDVVLTLPVTFKAAFPGLKNTYMTAFDYYGASSGTILKGTWSAPGVVAPQTVSVTPTPFTGGGVSLSALFADGNGANDLSIIEVLIASSPAAVSNCYIAVNVATNALVVGSQLGTLGTGSVLNGGTCLLNPANTTLVKSGVNATLNMPSLSFLSNFTGPQNVYLKATDSGALTTGFQQRGSAIVTTEPAVGTLTPTTESGVLQLFNFNYSEPNGHTDIHDVEILINNSFSTLLGCYIYVDKAGNAAYLYDNAGTSVVGGTVLSGSGTTVSNGQCQIRGANSSTSASGNSYTVNLTLGFTGSVGTRNIYMRAHEQAASGDRYTPWTQRGVYNVTVAPVIKTLTATPGPGPATTFVEKVGDQLAGTKWIQLQAATGSAPFGSPQCWVHFDKIGNAIYLQSGGDLSNFLGPITPGSASTLTNGNCTVNATGSSITTSGTDLIMTLSITFQRPAFSGTKTLFGRAADLFGGDSGFVARGPWTIP